MSFKSDAQKEFEDKEHSLKMLKIKCNEHKQSVSSTEPICYNKLSIPSIEPYNNLIKNLDKLPDIVDKAYKYYKSNTKSGKQYNTLDFSVPYWTNILCVSIIDAYEQLRQEEESMYMETDEVNTLTSVQLDAIMSKKYRPFNALIPNGCCDSPTCQFKCYYEILNNHISAM
jgi:hypothetical protein